jgi:hypothetical protein
MMGVQVKAVRTAYGQFQDDGDIQQLLQGIMSLREEYDGEPNEGYEKTASRSTRITRDNLRLICFDVVASA